MAPGATNLRITGGVRTFCPRCGGASFVPEGVYNEVRETLHVAIDPSKVSVRDLHLLQDALRRVERGEVPPELLQNFLSDRGVSENGVKLVHLITHPGPMAQFWVMVFLVVIQIVLAWMAIRGPRGVTPEQLERIVVRVVKQVEDRSRQHGAEAPLIRGR
jgi:hypothetical protein